MRNRWHYYGLENVEKASKILNKKFTRNEKQRKLLTNVSLLKLNLLSKVFVPPMKLNKLMSPFPHNTKLSSLESFLMVVDSIKLYKNQNLYNMLCVTCRYFQYHFTMIGAPPFITLITISILLTPLFSFCFPSFKPEDASCALTQHLYTNTTT